MSQLFTSGGQSIGVSASASVLPMGRFRHSEMSVGEAEQSRKAPAREIPVRKRTERGESREPMWRICNSFLELESCWSKPPSDFLFCLPLPLTSVGPTFQLQVHRKLRLSDLDIRVYFSHTTRTLDKWMATGTSVHWQFPRAGQAGIFVILLDFSLWL